MYKIFHTSSSGLGMTADLANTLQSLTSVANQANQLVPQSDAAYQSDFSKAAGKLSAIAGTGAALAAEFPPAAVVLGVVASVAAVLSKIFFASKAKALAAERQEYEKVISQILEDNKVIDEQYNRLKSAIDSFKNLIKGEVQLNGLGLCIINCKKKKEQKKLTATKETYNELVQIQKEKLNMVTDLYAELESLTSNLMKLNNSSNVITLLQWAFGLTSTVAVITYFRKVLNRKPKQLSGNLQGKRIRKK